MKLQLALIFFLAITAAYCQTMVLDQETNEPVSFATVSFGDGQGIFADDLGVFLFNKKLYPDVDSLFVSALGFKEFQLASAELKDTLFLEQEVDKLKEVLISVKLDTEDFKEETLKPYLDDDYYKCWLPTIESEIAVYFPKPEEGTLKLSSIHIPIALESTDWKKRKRSNADKKPFSTLFKVHIYANNNGFPGKPLTYNNITFIATEKGGDSHTIEVSSQDIYIPDDGIYVSIQVMGYTDEDGRLLPNKKYKEIKSGSGIVKIPTNFRPLLPFTDEIPDNRTYIKRVFINNNKWTQFKKGGIKNSSLLASGLNNYGMGISYRVYDTK